MSRLRRAAWPHPEWWALALSAAAWIDLVAGSAGSPGGGHAAHGSVLTVTSRWSIMVIAMMFPLVVGSIRTTAERSLWSRRHRAIIVFLAGYLATWLAAGVALHLAITTVDISRWVPSSLLAAVAFALAAAWQFGVPKWRAVRACHRAARLAPHGWRADCDCGRYGWMVGRQCVMSCGPLMLALQLTSHSVPILLSISALTLFERYAGKPVPSTFVVPAGLAVFYALGAAV
jgi:predicted metal-binding membrane protein